MKVPIHDIFRVIQHPRDGITPVSQRLITTLEQRYSRTPQLHGAAHVLGTFICGGWIRGWAHVMFWWQESHGPVGQYMPGPSEIRFPFRVRSAEVDVGFGRIPRKCLMAGCLHQVYVPVDGDGSDGAANIVNWFSKLL